MFYTFQQSRIWEADMPIDNGTEPLRIKARSEKNARKKLPKIDMGRTWILIETEEKAPVVPDSTPVRFVADYQMSGDMEGIAWANHVFGYAKTAGKINDFQALNSTTGPFGLQFVTFTVDAPIPNTMLRDKDQAVEYGTNLLCGIVSDSDVEVRWVGAIPEAV